MGSGSIAAFLLLIVSVSVGVEKAGEVSAHSF